MLRSSAGIVLVRLDHVDIRTVEELLGHSDVKTALIGPEALLLTNTIWFEVLGLSLGIHVAFVSSLCLDATDSGDVAPPAISESCGISTEPHENECPRPLHEKLRWVRTFSDALASWAIMV
ncbi:MAG: hypothetical protein R3E01_02845 [Pirellulaceae bacterium]